MTIITKDATIQNTDDEFPGSFQVVLSTPTKDREGEEVRSEEWKSPLPAHITFDMDHGMSVATTIGSGVPSLDAAGRLLVDGTYSSLPRAQEVRTLVKEGHIRTTSVAFSRHTTTNGDGTKSVTRELLNGAFVAIPANPEAVVLGSKAGARNSAKDQKAIQAAHDALVSAGASCAGPEDDSGASEDATGGKALGPNDTVSVSVGGSAGGLSVSVEAWGVPATELDAFADLAQRALAAALTIASAGPDADDIVDGSSDGIAAAADPSTKDDALASEATKTTSEGITGADSSANAVALDHMSQRITALIAAELAAE